ncbi:MAG: glycosyltransferase family 4 protein [Methanobrevibacter sp.]|nr:glycosyltransferase family 4 protein [Candidatus Methanovirga aequatorialis]
MIKVCLISRIFSSRGTGVGVYSRNLYDGLKNDGSLDISRIELDNQNLLKYLFNGRIKLHFKLPDADVYHGLGAPFTHTSNKDKTLVTIHDILEIDFFHISPFLDNNGKIVEWLNRLHNRRAVLKCKHIITTSNDTKDKLCTLYNLELDRISVVRMGFIDDRLSYKDKESDTYNIGTISALYKRKRVDILIKAFLKADIKNSRLFIGGEGAEEDYLRKIADGDDRVKFLGFISDEHLNDFYNNLNVFVFPTAYEGYGFPMVEAMKCRKSVVTLDDAYIPSDVKNRTHVSSINELANDLKHGNFNCDIESNLEFAKEHSPENMVKETKKVYRYYF